MRWLVLLLFACAPASAVVANAMQDADVVILGEVHDNPEHHRLQAEAVAALQPAALVFEMIPAALSAEADALHRRGAGRAEMAAALAWQEGGWPPFEDYAPIFEAAPQARIWGAGAPREDVRRAFSEGAAHVFGADAARFGLDQPLAAEEQAARETLQDDAHCNAMPPEMLGGLVAAQRYRDARFAQAVLTALEATGGPVVLITGNGHARTDWGVPAALAQAAPDLAVFARAHLEIPPEDTPPFDDWRVTAAAEREDPCAAFRSGD